MSISLGARVEYLSAEIGADKAFLQDTKEITFSNENMEVGYSNQRRPLCLAASINQIPVKRALVGMSAFVNLILVGTLQAVGISERKIHGCLMEVTRFGGKGEYTASHIQL